MAPFEEANRGRSWSRSAGKPMLMVTVLFLCVIAVALLLGTVVARWYSEPMNRLLRRKWGDGARTLGSVVE